jgi:hypothetical protein
MGHDEVQVIGGLTERYKAARRECLISQSRVSGLDFENKIGIDPGWQSPGLADGLELVVQSNAMATWVAGWRRPRCGGSAPGIQDASSREQGMRRHGVTKGGRSHA